MLDNLFKSTANCLVFSDTSTASLLRQIEYNDLFFSLHTKPFLDSKSNTKNFSHRVRKSYAYALRKRIITYSNDDKYLNWYHLRYYRYYDIKKHPVN